MKTNNILSTYCILAILTAIMATGCSPNNNQTSETTDADGEDQVTSLELEIPESHHTGGFALGTQAYTFNRFSVFEAIEKTAAAGGRVIELYPGQKVFPGEHEEGKLTPEASDEIIEAVRQKLADHDILPVNFGVVGLPNDQQQLHRVFSFAEKLGVQALTSEPQPEAMDLIEEMVREYDMPVAIHNHPPREDNPDYQHWDPAFVHGLVAGRDRRVGVCADIGHYVRSDIDPVEALKINEGRLISLHFTDVDRHGAAGEDTVAAAGVINIAAVLDELERQEFGGHISIEYENNWLANTPDVAHFIGFVSGWAETK